MLDLLVYFGAVDVFGLCQNSEHEILLINFLGVDKEVDIRKTILKIYNKQERDFSTLREYNDYLEEIEDIIWNLQTGRREKETKEKIAIYK